MAVCVDVSVEAQLIPNRTVLVGESFSLQCTVDIHSVVQWLQNGTNLRRVESTNNTVVVKNASLQHRGVYSCSVQGMIRKQIIVTVEGEKCSTQVSFDTTFVFIGKRFFFPAPPLIRQFSSNYDQRLLCDYSDLELSCFVSGNPVPTVTITGKGRLTSQSSAGRAVAFYRQVMPPTGLIMYTCSATNPHGTVNRTLYVRIGSKC